MSPGRSVELILYATPTGELAAAIDRYFSAVGRQPTSAQRYPPHCTLTGFFHDRETAVARYVAAAECAAGRPVMIEVVDLTTGPKWIGLELRSPDLEVLTAAFADAVAGIETRTDKVRVKGWLHVSLAYGHDARRSATLATLAAELVDPHAAAGWDLRLYERRSGEWTLHGSWPLAVA